MKKLIYSLGVSSLFLTLIAPNAFASFKDLDPDHPNYDAIIALKQTGVVNGYDDGTFRPYLDVNRVEFLKIIIEGSNIQTNITSPTPFNDVNESAWYGPYLKKAYSEGWINGYGDGSFRPENTINKVEALKIISIAQNWNLADSISEKPYADTPINAWYTPYVSYAKNASFIESSSNLQPDQLLSRGDISELIYLSRKNEIDSLIALQEEPEEENANQEEEIEEEEAEVSEEEDDEEEDSEEELVILDEEENIAVNFSPQSYRNINTGFFEDIELDDEIPNTYYSNEIFFIEGEITTGNYDRVTIILDPEKSGRDTEYFRADVENDEFSVPVFFKEQGNYNIGILPGSGGSSKAFTISVMPNLPNASNETSIEAENSFNMEYQDEQTYIDIQNDPGQLLKVVFTQGNDRVFYYNRQGKDLIAVNYSDFEEFDTGTISYYSEIANLNSEAPLEINSAFERSSIKSFSPTLHEFSEIDNEAIDIVLPETLSAANNFSFTANLNDSYAAKIAYAIRPDGFVDEITLESSGSEKTVNGSKVFGQNESISYEYDPDGSGTYIIEINNENGQAIVNTPLYIGNKIPILPNYFDLNPREFYEGDLDIEDAREELLEMINDARDEHGLDPVVLSNELNDLAQDHSEDMADNDFFAHINLDGENPNDRRIDAGINTAVSENIAKDVGLRFAHEGLMRSASHRQNILTPEWDRVGLGIIEEDGYLFISQEFSTLPLTVQNLQEMEEELLEAINDERSDLGIGNLSSNDDLVDVSEYINNKKINEGQALTNSLFTEALSTYNITGSSQALGRSFNIWNDILSSLISDEDELFDSKWKRIGIDVSTDSAGTIYTIVVINNQN